MNEIIRNIIYILITGVGVVLIKELMTLVNKKIDDIQLNIDVKDHEKLNKYIDGVQNVVNDVVLSVSQTYVDSLKSSGKFDATSQEEAKNKAIELATKMITEESKKAVVVLYGDFDTYLDSLIEAMVKKNKTTE